MNKQTADIVVGIDYSITSPAACAFTEDGEVVELIGYATSPKKVGTYKVGSFEVKLLPYQEWKTDMERYSNLANAFLEFVDGHKPKHVFIEDYAFGATGQVFNIGENTGLLKFMLYSKHYDVTPLSPGTIKKHATGSGAAKKEKMYEAWCELHPGLKEILGYTKGKSISSPISDLVDARFVASAGLEAIKSKA